MEIGCGSVVEYMHKALGSDPGPSSKKVGDMKELLPIRVDITISDLV